MQNYVITITRQFGSGGRDIALAVAKELGIPMYDRSNIEKEAQAMDESLCSLVQLTEKGITGYYQMAYPLGVGSSLKQDRMFEVQSQLVMQHAEQENCVILGRCACCGSGTTSSAATSLPPIRHASSAASTRWAAPLRNPSASSKRWTRHGRSTTAPTPAAKSTTPAIGTSSSTATCWASRVLQSCW